jgi:MFS family permease
MLKSVYEPYAEALRLHGAAKFSGAGFIARIPLAMVGLGILLFISNTTGSYAFAGFIQASFTLTAALAAVISSRMSDRYGQRIVLISLPSIFTITLFMFVFAVSNDYSRLWQTVLAVIAGATFPSFGSFVRTRWAFLTSKNERLLHSAFAWESILDELTFTIGPLVAVALAFNISFASPILVGAIITLVGALLLASLGESSPPPVTRVEHKSEGSALRFRGMTSTIVVALGVGALFGTFEVAVVAFMQEARTPQLAGLTLALWAASSMVGGLIYGSRRMNALLSRQLAYTTLALTIVVLPLAFITSPPLLIVAATLSGFVIAPTLICTFSLTQRLVPSKLLTEGLTWTNSGLAAGFALGASISGILVDRLGTAYAFGLGSLGAALALAASLFAQTRWNAAILARRNDSSVAIPVSLNQEPIPGPAPGAFLHERDAE